MSATRMKKALIASALTVACTGGMVGITSSASAQPETGPDSVACKHAKFKVERDLRILIRLLNSVKLPAAEAASAAEAKIADLPIGEQIRLARLRLAHDRQLEKIKCAPGTTETETSTVTNTTVIPAPSTVVVVPSGGVETGGL